MTIGCFPGPGEADSDEVVNAVKATTIRTNPPAVIPEAVRALVSAQESFRISLHDPIQLAIEASLTEVET